MGADLGGDHSKRKHLQEGSEQGDLRRLSSKGRAAVSRRKLDGEDDDADRRLFDRSGVAISQRRHLQDDDEDDRRLFGEEGSGPDP